MAPMITRGKDEDDTICHDAHTMALRRANRTHEFNTIMNLRKVFGHFFGMPKILPSLTKLLPKPEKLNRWSYDGFRCPHEWPDECGPTIVGDEWSDKELMSHLGAALVKSLGNNLFRIQEPRSTSSCQDKLDMFEEKIRILEYKSPDPPRIILDKLDKLGYTLVTTCGIGQTCIWTLHKPDTDKTNSTQNDNTEYR